MLPAEASMKDPVIARAADEVREDRLRHEVEQLVRYNRHRDNPGIGAVAAHMFDRFVAQGARHNDVRIEPFPFWSEQRNILYRVRRMAKSMILIGAHYDTALSEPGTGADDNASGVAALLELARLLSQRELTHDILFAAFGAEEANLHGSRYLAAAAVGQGWPISLMINLDMIGVPSGPTPHRVVVECDAPPHTTRTEAASIAFGALMTEMASAYTSLRAERSNIRASDHRSFEKMGFPCLGAFEGEGNPHRHRVTDVVETLDFAYLAQVVRMVLATVLTIAT